VSRADRIVIAIIALVAVAAWPLVAAAGGGSDDVVIAGPAGTTVVPLHVDGTFMIEGLGGPVTVVVSDGWVRVSDSCCPDHVCMRSGAISAPGSLIACVPNGVVVRVGGGGDDGLDARVR
jgi:hypothetical protein